MKKIYAEFEVSDDFNPDLIIAPYGFRILDPAPQQEGGQELDGFWLSTKYINEFVVASLKDLIRRASACSICDVDLRENGQNVRFEADWIKYMEWLPTQPERSGLAQEAATIKQSLTVGKDSLTTEAHPAPLGDGWRPIDNALNDPDVLAGKDFLVWHEGEHMWESLVHDSAGGICDVDQHSTIFDKAEVCSYSTKDGYFFCGGQFFNAGGYFVEQHDDGSVRFIEHKDEWSHRITLWQPMPAAPTGSDSECEWRKVRGEIKEFGVIKEGSNGHLEFHGFYVMGSPCDALDSRSLTISLVMQRLEKELDFLKGRKSMPAGGEG